MIEIFCAISLLEFVAKRLCIETTELALVLAAQDKCFSSLETVHNKWCIDKSVGQTENDLERGFIKHWLTPFK